MRSAAQDQATISSRMLVPIVAAGTAAGVASHELLDAVGIDARVLDDPDSRVPLRRFVALWEEAVKKLGDPLVGLHAAEQVRTQDFDVLGYLGRSSANLLQSFDITRRYTRLFADSFEVGVSYTRANVRMTFAVNGFEMPRAWAEYVVAGYVVAGRQTTGVHWIPREVHFVHRRRGSVAEYERVFGCPVLFGTDELALVISRETAELPTVGADPQLHRVLERYVQLACAALPTRDDFVDRVRAAVLAELRRTELSQRSVAAALGISTRTLLRRLTDAGTSYRRISTEVRMELGRHYLADERLSIEDVAFLLGFASASVFRRAFRQWTGRAPIELKRELTRRTG